MKIAVLGEGVTGKAVVAKIKDLPGFEIVPFDQQAVAQSELIVASPGIPQEQLPETDAEIISEIEFAYRLFQEQKNPPKIIAVTGTNGKTTVTSLLAHILEIPYAGNIGVPLISFVNEQIKKNTIAVEVSSYQLELCKLFKPDIAIWLNQTPDHLERHKTMEEYSRVKSKVFQNFEEHNALIYLETDPIIKRIVDQSSFPFKRLPLNLANPLISKFKDMQLIGDHNKLNALASYLAALELGLSEEKIIEKLNSFKAVEHRIEFVLNCDGREFYNDSKGTNPDSTEIAVKAFNKPINLIICGKDKHLPLEVFIKFLHQRVKTITIFGEITARFKKVSQLINPDYQLFEVGNIRDALVKSYSLAAKDEIILFSPSCSSFDQFVNFEERGRIFKELVQELYGKS